MQKVLLASTALVMTTGWAMADVTNAEDGLGASITLDGFAEMGIQGRDEGDLFGDEDDDDIDVGFHTDVDLQFEMRGQTDGGLEFGVDIDLDETSDDDAFNDFDQGGEELFLRGAFGNLYMGDTDGAFDWAMQESIFGDTLTDDLEHAGYSGNAGLDGLFYDGQIARYDYTFAGTGIGVAFSAELDDTGEGDPILGLGAKYDFAASGMTFTVGGGLQFVDDIGDETVFGVGLDDTGVMIYGISGRVAMQNGFSINADYSWIEYDFGDGVDPDLDDNGSHWGLAAAYEMGPWLFAANVGHFDAFIERDTDSSPGETVARLGDSEGFGLAVNYDLGGGAVLAAGYGYSDRSIDALDLDAQGSSYSFGVIMNF